MIDNDFLELVGLDYLGMLKEAKNIDGLSLSKVIRVAMLGDFATQQLSPLLKAYAARKGVRLELYEADYDSIDLEIFDPNSKLYEFNPQYVFILHAAQKLKAKILATNDRQRFVEDTVSKMVGRWEVFAQRSSAAIVQSNFILPSERAYGNYELMVEESMGSIFAEINTRLAKAARNAKNVLLCDLDFIAGEVGRRHWFDDRLWSMAKTFCNLDYLPIVAKSLLDIVFAAQGTFVKCVVLDLDNTLWGGVIGDDGVQGIALGDYDEGESFVTFQKFILELKRRGIILAVVSKNEHSNAVLPFREHPSMMLKEEDIAVFVANWDNKADNIRLVQKTLNIGFDSMVFIDDNPFERNIVRQYLPEVIVPEISGDEPERYLRVLADLNLFETASFSEADKKRADQYREEAQRELTKTHFTNIDEYLRSLEMTVKIERFTPLALPRIAQLIQRSNQFNLCTRRYGEAKCEELANDANALPLTLTLSDKFGDYGLISVIISRICENDLHIDEYLMSCRVLKRGVEQFAMNEIFSFAAAKGLKRVVGSYIKSAKNDMVKNFYRDFGFEQIACDENGNTEWALTVDCYAPRQVFMSVLANDLNA